MNNMEKNSNESFWMVMPTWVFQSDKLTLKAKILYGVISTLTKKEGYCWASNNYLAKQSGISKRMVIYHIQALEHAGLVKTERGENTRKIYLTGVMEGATSFTPPGAMLLHKVVPPSATDKPSIAPNIIDSNTDIAEASSGSVHFFHSVLASANS